MTLTLIEPRRERRQPDNTPKPSYDRFGRRIDYLRISLTDRCNLRCVYCMPATGMRFAPQDELLSDAEFLRVIRLTTELGFRKFRLTGGEPTVRPNLPALVAAIRATSIKVAPGRAGSRSGRTSRARRRG